MVAISRGENWWADRAEPSGFEPGLHRPVVVFQCDAFNRSNIQTVACVPLTRKLVWADAPGNVLLPSSSSGLVKDSVANVSQIITVDRESITERAGRVLAGRLEAVLNVLGALLG